MEEEEEEEEAAAASSCAKGDVVAFLSCWHSKFQGTWGIPRDSWLPRVCKRSNFPSHFLIVKTGLSVYPKS